MSPSYTVISEGSFVSTIPSSGMTPSKDSAGGLLEPAQPAVTSSGITSIQSPSPDQNPFPASDMGLTFFGVLLLVCIFLAGLLVLVSKYMGKRGARKALKKMQKDEEAQAQVSEVKIGDTSSIVSEETIDETTQTNNIQVPDTLSVGTVMTNDQDKQFIVGEEDITDAKLEDEDEDEDDQKEVQHEDLEGPAAFFNAKRSGIIGASAIYTTSTPADNDEVRSASLLFIGTTTKTVPADSVSDTTTIPDDCSQPLQAESEDLEEDITEAFGRLFLSSGDSVESLSQESGEETSTPANEVVTETPSVKHPTSVPEASSVTKSEKPTPITRNRVSLSTPNIIKGTPHLPSYAHCFTMPSPTSRSEISKNTLSPNTVGNCTIHKNNTKPKLSSHPTRPSRDHTPPLYDEDTVVFAKDCFLLPEVKLNPNPPQKYAADFEAYCRGRNSRKTTARAQDCTTKQEDIENKSTSVTTVSEPLPTPIVTIDAPCSDDQTNISTPSEPPSESTSRTSPEPTSKDSLSAAKGTYLAVPKISLRTGRMAEQPKADLKASTTTTTKRRNRSTTIVAPRNTVSKVELKQSGGRVVSAAGGFVLARQTLLQRSSTGRVRPTLSPPKRPLVSLPPILECVEVEATDAKIASPASPTSTRPLKIRNTNTSGSYLRAALVSKNSADSSLRKDSMVFTRNNQENTPLLCTSHLGSTSLKNSRILKSATQPLKGSFAGSSVNGLSRASHTSRTVGAQKSQAPIKRSSISSWH